MQNEPQIESVNVPLRLIYFALGLQVYNIDNMFYTQNRVLKLDV
jgi:hypothetical protein